MGNARRLGLARALYDNPFLVVLDEPNSNLDGEGEAALAAAIKAVRARGGIAVVIAHRPSVLEAVDHIAVIQDGRMTAFGPKDQIMGLPTQRTGTGPDVHVLNTPAHGRQERARD